MSLHYGEPQVAIGVVFLVLAVLLASAFWVIGAQAGSDVSVERVQRVGYWLRKRWMAVLVVVGVCVVGISFVDLPYASGPAAHRVLVHVRGGQFYWLMSPAQVRAGTPVRFDITSIDVNHGFGLYDPDGHLIGSVQAMPGYHNRLDLTLTEPGSYPVRCLELCGLNHATMQAAFTVVAR